MGGTGTKVLAAMSGGVDSAVAAALLLEAGFEVRGVYFHRGRPGRAAEDPRRVAEQLGIPLDVLDLSEPFEQVTAYFCTEYTAGRTPNPCIRCNQLIKFGVLLDYAESVGCGAIATGHHARIVQARAPRLARGLDRAKDQSYALFGIGRDRLQRVRLPIGTVTGKDAVRRIAAELDLPVHDKPDSQEICFIPDDDHVGYLREHAPEAMQPGSILDVEGNVLGEHEGIGQFTVGQRRGLGVAAGEPLYVTGIDPQRRAVIAGDRAEVMGRTLAASGANWHADLPDAFAATVQIRYNHRGAPAWVTRTGEETFEVEFGEEVHAITPGQAAVCYHGDVVLGGGWIERRLA